MRKRREQASRHKSRRVVLGSKDILLKIPENWKVKLVPSLRGTISMFTTFLKLKLLEPEEEFTESIKLAQMKNARPRQ